MDQFAGGHGFDSHPGIHKLFSDFRCYRFWRGIFRKFVFVLMKMDGPNESVIMPSEQVIS